MLHCSRARRLGGTPEALPSLDGYAFRERGCICALYKSHIRTSGPFYCWLTPVGLSSQSAEAVFLCASSGRRER